MRVCSEFLERVSEAEQNGKALDTIFRHHQGRTSPRQPPHDVMTAFEHAIRLLALYTGYCGSCSVSELLEAAGHLTTVCNSCHQLWRLAAAAMSDSASKKLQLARHITETGVLDAIAKASAAVVSVLQQSQPALSPEQLHNLLMLAEALILLPTCLAMAWPQNVFKARAFERCLVSWADLAGLLPAVVSNQLAATSADSSSASSNSRSRLEQIVSNCLLAGVYLAGAVVTAPGGDKGSLQPTSPAMQAVCLSAGLQRLLVLTLATITAVRYKQWSGDSSQLSAVSTTFTDKHSSDPNSSNKHQLLPPPHHQQLLLDLGLSKDSLDHGVPETSSSREAQCIAAQALQLVCVLAADEAGRTPGLAFCSRPLPAIRLSSSSSIGGSSKGGGCYIIANTAAPDVTTCPYPCGTLSSGSGSTASAADPATSSCCSQPWHLSMMLTIAELIALDSVSDIPATIQHLELLGTCVNLLATTDVRGALVLPAAAAVALLQPVLQLLVPAVLQLLRSTATTTGWERKYLLQSLMNLFSVVLGQVGVSELANCMSTEPLMAAVACEAVVRMYVEVVTAKHADFQCQLSSLSMAAVAGGATKDTFRVILALQQLLQDSRDSTAGHARRLVQSPQGQQLRCTLASLLATGLKVASAMASRLSVKEVSTSRYLGHSSMALNQAATTAVLGCQLGDAAVSQQALCVAAQISSAPVISSSLGRSSVAMGTVLVARSLLLLSDTAQQAYTVVGQAILGNQESATSTCHSFCVRDTIPLEHMTRVCLYMLNWFKGQLLGMAWLSVVESSTGSSTSSAAKSAMTADHDVLQDLLQQRLVAAEAMQLLRTYLTAYQEALWLVGEGANNIEMSLAATAATALIQHKPFTEVWNSCWQGIQQFCSSVCDQLPLSTCCNNPGCLNLDKLSEQQLVGGKGCVCGGCGVARYCSAECQKQHWKRHKPACKRLKSAGKP